MARIFSYGGENKPGTLVFHDDLRHARTCTTASMLRMAVGGSKMRRWLSILLFGLLVPCALTQASDAHRVASPAVPDVEFRVDAEFAALPALRFPIRDQTDAERRLFVDV